MNEDRFQVYAEVPPKLNEMIEQEVALLGVSKATIVRWALNRRYGLPAPSPSLPSISSDHQQSLDQD